MPGFNAQVLPQGFQIANRGMGVVVLEFGVGRGLAAASLVKLHDVEGRGVEVLPVGRLATSSRATVNDHHGDAVGVPALLPRDGVHRRDGQHAGGVGLNGRVENIGQRGGGVKHGPW